MIKEVYKLFSDKPNMVLIRGYINYINKNPKLKSYLESYYDDSESLKETLWRIKFNINKRPVCKVCGNPVKFFGRINKIFLTTCCEKCNIEWTKQERIKHLKENYGVENVFQLKTTKDKIKKTCLEKYGVENPFLLEKIKENRKKKYGVEYLLQSNKIRDKIKQTFFKKYGGITPMCDKNIQNKKNQTCIKKYGISVVCNLNKEESIKKGLQTKRKNHTFNTSKPEEKYFEYLKSIYNENDILRQYTSEKYPFVCDFYIISEDKYIEYQGSWTHGGHPFNSNSKEDINKLKLWESKNTQYYNNAINTWTKKDVLKRKIAKENNLNFEEIWP